MTITALPTSPSRAGRPSTFQAESAAFLSAMPLFKQELEGDLGEKTADFSGLAGVLIGDLPAFDYLDVSFLVSSATAITFQGLFQPGSASGLLTTTTSYRVRDLHALNTNIIAGNPVGTSGARTIRVSGSNERAGRIRICKMGASNVYAMRVEASWPRSSAAFTNTRLSGTFVLPSRMTQFQFHSPAVVAPIGLLKYRWR